MEPISCKFCSLRGVDAKFSTLDERRRHAEFHALKLGYKISEKEKDQASLKLVFAECFPFESYEQSVGKLEDIEKSRSSLLGICQRIINAKKNETNSIDCHKCGSKVRYKRKDGNGRKSQVILNHACHHSTKKPFSCRQCHSESAYKRNMIQHVKDFHQIASPDVGVHFDENWTECFNEIKSLLAKCFGGTLTMPRCSPKIPNTPSKLSILRRSVFLNTFKTVSEAKKIRCDHCRIEICATGGKCLENHIRFHLQQRLLECAMCGDTFIHSSGIIRHLAKNHSFPPKGNYIDHSDEYHDEIMDWVKKCFGKEDVSK